MRLSRRSKRTDKRNITIGLLSFIVVVETALLLSLYVKRPAPPPEQKARIPAKVEKVEKPRVALVIDDWGYNLKNQWFLESVDFPVTISVLPFLPYSRRIVDYAASKNKDNVETILHLPLEPHYKNEIGLERKVIFTTMTKEQILAVLNESLANIGFAKGVSNHMGSKATENHAVMAAIFGDLKKRDMFFLDSVVTPDSACQEEARKAQLRFVKRSVFLDNEQDATYIRNQLDELIERARRAGAAVGIGHDRPLTLKVLQEYFKNFRSGDIEIVFVSALAQ